jgi:hypothetical protein
MATTLKCSNARSIHFHRSQRKAYKEKRLQTAASLFEDGGKRVRKEATRMSRAVWESCERTAAQVGDRYVFYLECIATACNRKDAVSSCVGVPSSPHIRTLSPVSRQSWAGIVSLTLQLSFIVPAARSSCLFSCSGLMKVRGSSTSMPII